MPKFSSFASKISCLGVSKAFCKSTKIPQSTLPLSKFSLISSVRLIKKSRILLSKAKLQRINEVIYSNEIGNSAVH